MATGLTYQIYEDCSFEDFTLTCARQFGALIHMRDDCGTAEITLPEVSDHHLDSLAEDMKRLKELNDMSAEEIVKKTASHNNEALSDYKKSVKDNDDKLHKLNTMLNKVRAWEPPTKDHEGLKALMEKQILETIDWDIYSREKPKPITVNEWFENQIESAQWGIDYHKKNLRESAERNDGRQDWIVKLFKSLGIEHKVKGLKKVKF